MRSFCPEICIPLGPWFDIRAFEIYKNDTFSYCSSSCQITSLFVAMGQRIPGKQDMSSMIIEGPQGPLNSKTNYSYSGQYMKNRLLIFPLLYICLQCDEVSICRHFGAHGTSGFYVRTHNDSENNDIFCS